MIDKPLINLLMFGHSKIKKKHKKYFYFVCRPYAWFVASDSQTSWSPDKGVSNGSGREMERRLPKSGDDRMWFFMKIPLNIFFFENLDISHQLILD